MPYPLVHLAVARRLLPSPPAVDLPAWYLGAIAPDAYRQLRPGKDLGERAKAHLMSTAAADLETRLRDMPGARFSFDGGYLLHLLVDLFWDEAVLRPILAAVPYAAYANDMAVLDVALYARERAEEEIFPHLAQAKPAGFGGLVSPEQVKLERDLTLSWYRAHLGLLEAPLQGALGMPQLLRAVDEAAAYAVQFMI